MGVAGHVKKVVFKVQSGSGLRTQRSKVKMKEDTGKNKIKS